MADTKQATNWARIDDQSDLIAYSNEGWFTTKLEGASNNTLTATDAKGASAKVQFHGNRAAVIGAVSFDNSTGAPISQYVLDGGSPVLHKPRVDQNNSLEVAFYLSPILSDGVHTLVITLVTDGTPFFLDSVLYNASTADMTVTNSAGATQRPTLVTTIIATPSSLVQGPAEAEARSTVPVGPIVGGVVGGVALLVGALLAWYFLYWRRRSQGYRSAARDDYDVLGSELKPAPQGGSYSLSATPAIVPYNAFASPSTSPRPNQQQPLQQQQQSYPPQPNRADSAYSAPSVYSGTTSAPSHYSLDPNAPPVPPIPAPYADPYASSQSGSSVSGATGRSSGRLAVVNDTAGETPALSAAQRKAREAGIRDSAAPYAQAVDSGHRFDTQAGSSGAGPSNAHVAPGELPPVYSES